MKKNKNIKKIILSCIVLIILTIFCLTIFSIFNTFSNKIISGVYINNINVSGYTKEQLEHKIMEIINKLENKEIVCKYKDIDKTIKLSELKVKYDIQEALDIAFNIGRNNNIVKNNIEIIKTLIYKKYLNINISYDKIALKNKIESMLSIIPNAVEEYNYYIEDNELIITKGKKGLAIDNIQLNKLIEQEIQKMNINTNIINIPVYNKEPDKLDIQKIHSEIYKEPQDAFVDKTTNILNPSVDGIDFAIDLDEVNKLLDEEKSDYRIPLKIIKPDVTIEDLGENAFPNILGEFMTRYDPTNTNRANNVELATNKLNNTIIMPGEIFSYNKVVGKRTIDLGYKEAGAYAGGKVIQEVGGGICQVSSTLYNAILYANLPIVERSNHFFETSYVDPGRDATVSWGTVDLKFKNNRKYPIKIEASSKNGVTKTIIKGIKEKDDYNIVIKSEINSIIQKTTKYEENNYLIEGQEIVKQKGHDGCTSQTVKIYYKNGIEEKKEIISNDYYHALDEIIERKNK